MPAYVVVTYDITDPKGYESYVPGVLPLLQKHGAEILVADYAAEALEGKAPGVTVVLKFPSEQAARDWYNDPAYAPVRQIRFASASNNRMLLSKPFVMPSA